MIHIKLGIYKCFAILDNFEFFSFLLFFVNFMNVIKYCNVYLFLYAKRVESFNNIQILFLNSNIMK